MKHPKSVLAYFERVGAEVTNFRRAIVKTYKGQYYIERAIIKINSDGTVTCGNKEYAPTAEEAAAMKAELEGIEFPRTVTVKTTRGLKLPKTSMLFEFWDRSSGEIIMVQERMQKKDGSKAYRPWVYLSTGEWACMEPDGELPFWKPKKGRGPGARIMVHEGPKAAFAAQAIAEELNSKHPWADSLKEYEHWGIIGGALAPGRADYAELERESPSEVIIFCDNDRPGIRAAEKISKLWRRSVKRIVTGEKWPQAWDIADPMPKRFFTPSGRYTGPALEQLIEPATWATEIKPDQTGKGRPAIIIRDDFAEEWIHCVSPEVYLHRDFPHRIKTAQEFNNLVQPFSDVDDTARLIRKDSSSKAAVLKFMPGERPGIHAGSTDGLWINTYQDSSIKPEDGDEGPWIEFMGRLVPDEKDRGELLRWCATLIARPAVRMLYGVLLISETQGIGKGTLGEKILAPIVGGHNTSFPSEQQIVESQFNTWLAHKRLAVVHEIYAGQSSKAYNKLKSCITDRYVSVNKKYQPEYEIENWVHIFACSNSMRALKLSMDDRRWFVPRVTEEKQTGRYWEDFNRWLGDEGGLGIIRAWAGRWLESHEAVEHGEAAPWSSLKQQIVEEGYSAGQALVARMLDELKMKVEAGELPSNIFTTDVDLVRLIRDQLYDGRQSDKLERPSTLRKVAQGCGWTVSAERAQIKAWGRDRLGCRVISLNPEVAGGSPAELCNERMATEFRRHPLELSASM